MEFVAILIGHTGITLTKTLDPLTAAFSKVRSRTDQANANKGTLQPTVDSNARSHDYGMFKSLLGRLTDLAQSRLLGIIRNKKHLVEALPRAVRQNLAHSAATPTHTHAATHYGAPITTNKTRTTRAPESTAIS